MITRVVKMTFRPGETEHFLKIFTSMEQQIRLADGCLDLKLLIDAGNENTYFTLSSWQTEDHLNTYRSSNLFKDIWAKVKPLFCEKTEAWSLLVPKLN